jgi:hypothetical protein
LQCVMWKCDCCIIHALSSTNASITLGA